MASAKRSSVGRWFVAAALALASIPAMAQLPPPLAQPNVPLLTNGVINAIVRTTDGGIIIGGDFTSVGGAARSNLARFRPDGTLDASWNASTNGPVNALALDASGNLFVGGLFDDASGQGRFCLAKFSAAGAVDVAWTAWADAPVLAVAVADDSVFIGGYFLSVATEPRSRLAKLSATGAGALDESWVVPANNRVIALQAGASGTLYAAGAFTSIGDANASYLAKISTSGAGEVDATLGAGAGRLGHGARDRRRRGVRGRLLHLDRRPGARPSRTHCRGRRRHGRSGMGSNSGQRSIRRRDRHG